MKGSVTTAVVATVTAAVVSTVTAAVVATVTAAVVATVTAAVVSTDYRCGCACEVMRVAMQGCLTTAVVSLCSHALLRLCPARIRPPTKNLTSQLDCRERETDWLLRI